MKRDWNLARSKVEREGRCRVCAEDRAILQAAHVIGRTHDVQVDGVAVVDPLDVVPLCEPCHRRYDGRSLDLLPHLTIDEQARAVGHVGIARAMNRLTGARA